MLAMSIIPGLAILEVGKFTFNSITTRFF
jgi:hypothetical protein